MEAVGKVVLNLKGWVHGGISRGELLLGSRMGPRHVCLEKACQLILLITAQERSALV